MKNKCKTLEESTTCMRLINVHFHFDTLMIYLLTCQHYVRYFVVGLAVDVGHLIRSRRERHLRVLRLMMVMMMMMVVVILNLICITATVVITDRDNGTPVEWNYSDHCLSSWFLVNIVPRSTVVVAGAALSGCTSLALSLVYLATVVQQNFGNLIKNQKPRYFQLILFQWICLHYTCGVTRILGSMGELTQHFLGKSSV